jgi:hypothetical protein
MEMMIMARFRLWLLALSVVFVVSAVSIGSASADSCTGGTHLVFCTSPGNLPLVGELVLGTGGLALVASILGGAEAKFDCPLFDFHGVLEKLGAYTLLLLFLTCKEEKPAGCKLSAADEKEVHTEFIGQKQSLTLGLVTGSGPGEEITSFHVENAPGKTCIQTGTFSITGRQMVEMSEGATVDKEVTAKKSESFMKLGVERASFSGIAKVHLGGANIGSAWLVMHGE